MVKVIGCASTLNLVNGLFWINLHNRFMPAVESHHGYHHYLADYMPLIKNSDPPQQCRWHAYQTTAELEHAAAQAILHAAQQAISRRGAFHIVL
ncbi:hypothetical protein, partial [Acidiphilium sp.]|uniref:hypothetical protein n=1 Tax=Acidiphilium sp. TaxID=527 RepID=UPI00258A0CCB